MILNLKYKVLIYPAREDGLPVILWNLVSQREINRIYNGNRTSAPQWSPDGSQFVISAPSAVAIDGITYNNIDDGLPRLAGSDLFLVKYTGEIKRLTYFTISEDAWLGDYSWSPDGQYIAFLLQRSDFSGVSAGELSIVDVETGDVTNYCINGSYVWSLDDQYVVVSQVDESLSSRVLLINLKNGLAWQIAEDVSVDGWMTSP